MIPYGIDTATSRPIRARRSGSDGTRTRRSILSVGSQYSPQDDRKGFAVLLESFERIVRKELPAARLVIIGRRPRSCDPRRRLRSAATSSRGELAVWYAAADVFALPSLGDNAPLAVLEAMAREAPVVATRVGGIPEEVESGATGAPRPAARSDVCSGPRSCGSSAIPRLRASLGAAGRRRVLARFSRARAWAAHEELYRSLVSRRMP